VKNPKSESFDLPPADLDLREFDWMPLNVTLLRDSDLMMRAEPEALRAALLLWCASWHQIPSGSLPNDERVLMALAGLRGDSETWARIRDDAMHKFVLRTETGRLHHPVISKYAMEAAKRKFDAKKAAATRWKGHVPPPRKPRKNQGENAPALPPHMRSDMRSVMRDACPRNAIEKEKEKEQSLESSSESLGSELPNPPEKKEPRTTSVTEPRAREIDVEAEARRLIGDEVDGMAVAMLEFVSPREVVVALQAAATKREPVRYFASVLGKMRDRKAGVQPVQKPKPRWDPAL
jgi:hypothetical protein